MQPVPRVSAKRKKYSDLGRENAEKRCQGEARSGQVGKASTHANPAMPLSHTKPYMWKPLSLQNLLVSIGIAFCQDM